MKWDIKKQEDIETVAIDSSNKDLYKKCEKFEYEVFLQSGYIKPNPEKRISDFDQYERCKFLAVFAGDKKLPLSQRQMAGNTRLIYSSKKKMGPNCFPFIDIADKLHIYPDKYKKILMLDPRRTLDIATMSIRAEYRNSKASKAIITAIMLDSWTHGFVRYAFMATDTPFYKKLAKRGLPIEELGPSTMYWGSPTIATLIDSFQIPKGLQKIILPLCYIKSKINMRLDKIKKCFN